MRIFAICLLLCIPCLAVAQPKPDGRAKLEVVIENGASAIKITESGKVAMAELLKLYAECRNAVVASDSKLGGELDIAIGTTGKSFTGEPLDLFVQDALESARLGFRVAENGVLLILPLVEMMTRSATLTEEELAKANPAYWANVVFSPRHTDVNALRSGLQNLTSRHGGQINPVVPSAVIICDRVDRLRQLLKAAREIDVAAAQTLKTYALPEGVEAAAAEKALRDLFTDAKDPRATRVTVIAATRKILVLARDHVHAQVTDSIKQLK